MNYIKKTFQDKKVIKAILIIVIALAIAVGGYYLFENKIFKMVSLFVGTILMFIQFPVISNTAMRYAEEEEALEREEKQKQMHPKKKK